MINASHQPDPRSEQTWLALVARLRPYLSRRLGCESDVDDVLQEIFLRVQRGLFGLRDARSFGPWIYQVARSALYDHLRASRRQPVATEDLPEVVAEVTEDRRAEQQLAQCARVFVTTLPPLYREALELTELQGLSQKEAAERLGVSVSGMKSRVQRGRRKLRAAIEDCCQVALDARRRVIDYERRSGAILAEGEGQVSPGASSPHPPEKGSR